MVSKIKRFLAAFLMLVLIIGLLPSINASAATTQTGIMLFDYSDNGDYTSRLNSQLAVTYKPNGTDSAKTAYIKNLGWHFARYGGVAYADDPLYCIEPYRNYGASTSGNSVDCDVTLSGSGSTTGSNVWYALPEERREAIGLILLYSDQMWDDSISVTTTARDNNPNVPLRVATQFLIYEIVCGLRDPSTFTLNSTNESGTAGDIFYNAGAAAISDFAPNYNTLVSNIQAAMKRPSFTGSSSSGAPTITLTGDETSVYDSNGVLSNWSFTDGSGAEFYKSGNTLYITQIGTISESTVFKATRSVPSAYNSSFNLWYMSGSTYQTTISLASASTGTAYAYFKLDPPSAATLSITKTTEDGTNLQGWQFGIYSDSACTNLLSGPHTTDSSGNITVSDLSTATVYVKEIGHSDSAINGKYTCESTNPQKVTLTAGQTSTVSFHNKLKTGSVKLVKETNTGENLGGWQIGLYFDSACTNAVSGSPFTTANDGTITVNGLLPGTLYAKELPVDDAYWQMDSSIKTVTVAADQTATVTFSNTHLGRIKFQKTTNTGNQLEGWTFRVKDSEYNIVGEYTTDASGVAYSDYLTPGRYTVIELSTEDLYWNCEFGFHDVTVAGGEDVVDEWLNREQGLGWFYKQTNTGESVDGWHITVYADEACTQELYTVITNEDGRAGYYIETNDTDEIGIVINSFGTMTKRLNHLINEIYKMQLEKKAVELKALQAQINPHFLYNALSSINWKAIRQGNDDISHLTGTLATFYRTSLNNGESITSVENELANIRAYIEIQRHMHDFPFRVDYEIEEGAMQLRMLNFLLQPIVENAFKHGIDYTDETQDGHIQIKCYTAGEYLFFTVANNGPQIPVRQVRESLLQPGKGYGIYNIQERIALYYGENCGLSAGVDENGYTCFVVKIRKSCTIEG